MQTASTLAPPAMTNPRVAHMPGEIAGRAAISILFLQLPATYTRSHDHTAVVALPMALELLIFIYIYFWSQGPGLYGEFPGRRIRVIPTE